MWLFGGPCDLTLFFNSLLHNINSSLPLSHQKSFLAHEQSGICKFYRSTEHPVYINVSCIISLCIIPQYDVQYQVATDPANRNEKKNNHFLNIRNMFLNNLFKRWQCRLNANIYRTQRCVPIFKIILQPKICSFKFG